MKWLMPAILVCSALCLSSPVSGQRSQKEAPLTNAAIVKLTKAGFKERTIISIIAAREAHFDLNTDRMIELKRSGVSEKIIIAMLARQQGEDVSDEAWGDDLFPNEGPDRKAGGSTATNSDPGSMDIFGSSGGVKGRTQSRGADGSIAQDTQTTGSATVRILRPPTEAGGGTTKLEKTPTLTNDSVVELVEAGFSEGTIIRRIEQSPVEFDLSSSKLDELRKRRVSDKILTAMRVAMGDDSSK
jgi:hypothetical protein